MNGPQDMGGRAGFGPVEPEVDEPVFHAEWEKTALGLTLCAGALGHWNLDGSRHARECLPPAKYLTSSYYDIWLTALENLLVEHGEVTREELARGEVLQPGVRPERMMPAEKMMGVLKTGGPVDRSAQGEPAFAVGDRVRLSGDQVTTHTRRPTYAMGKVGTVTGIRGYHVYPDTAAHGHGEQPCWLYGVTFDGQTLWGTGAEPDTEVTIDAFERYLSHV